MPSGQVSSSALPLTLALELATVLSVVLKEVRVRGRVLVELLALVLVSGQLLPGLKAVLLHGFMVIAFSVVSVVGVSIPEVLFLAFFDCLVV